MGHSRQGIVYAKVQGCKLETRAGVPGPLVSGVQSLELGTLGKGCRARQGPQPRVWSGKRGAGR